MKQSLVRYWEKSGIIWDKRAINAFKSLRRESFVLKDYARVAYDDRALPIHAAQTISQPTTVMIMTQALEVRPGHKVLEVGTGSGYQAAILGRIVGDKGMVYSTEIIPELVKFAKSNLKKEKVKNVKVLHCDGSEGYAEGAPYDRIIVTAAAPEVPKPLISQLKENGILIAPVGSLFTQEMMKIKKKGKGLKTKELGYFMFVPLKGKHGIK